MGILGLTVFQLFYVFGFILLAFFLMVRLQVQKLFPVAVLLVGVLWLIHAVTLVAACLRW